MKYYHYKNEETPSTASFHHHKKDSKDITINVKCGDGGRERMTPAFRALKTGVQPLVAGQSSKITFEEEQFDIGNIYNSTNSTFVPRESGVYYVAASFTFAPDENIPYRTRADIVVNGITVQVDNDYWDQLANLNVVNVSAVLQLQAGDLVEIFGQSTVDGFIEPDVEIPNFGFSSNFEAFKVS
ncbi:complement C1q domain-containing protein [Sutcliffiella horikoshii]|uniref:C1q-like domain-containing protein n=1 Tax=Sutcliffiella horikoshii TaxID=79883 RepID=UPI00384E084D